MVLGTRGLESQPGSLAGSHRQQQECRGLAHSTWAAWPKGNPGRQCSPMAPSSVMWRGSPQDYKSHHAPDLSDTMLGPGAPLGGRGEQQQFVPLDKNARSPRAAPKAGNRAPDGARSGGAGSKQTSLAVIAMPLLPPARNTKGCWALS